MGTNAVADIIAHKYAEPKVFEDGRLRMTIEKVWINGNATVKLADITTKTCWDNDIYI